MASEYADSGVEMAERCRKLGASAERVFLTHAEADTDAAAKRLDGVTGIWFGGGDQSRLTAALAPHEGRSGDRWPGTGPARSSGAPPPGPRS